MDSVDDKTLLRNTLLTVVAMVGACVVVIGCLSLFALFVVGRATDPAHADDRAQVSAPATQDSAARPAPAAKPPIKPSQI